MACNIFGFNSNPNTEESGFDMEIPKKVGFGVASSNSSGSLISLTSYSMSSTSFSSPSPSSSPASPLSSSSSRYLSRGLNSLGKLE